MNFSFDFILFKKFCYLEFVPYVLQILGFLIESHPTGSTPLPEAYRILFQSILTPAFWDRSGNIPALSRLLQAYIEKGGENIVLEKLTIVLGIFQRLVSQSKVHDHEGFAILNSLVVHLPRIHLENYLKDIFVVIFTRLTKAKTQKLIKCIIIFFCYFVVKYGAQELITQVDNIQANMFQMVIDRLFLPELSKIDENDKKLCAIGVTHLLCDPIPMISGVYFVQLWLPLLQSLLQLFESSNELQTMSYAEKKKQAQEEAEDELLVGLDDTPDYTPAFSCLAFAKKPHIDIFSTSIPDARCHLAKCLQTLTASHPNQFLNLMKTGLSTEHLSHIQKYCSLANVTLI
ncbi:unnamed protein product [Rotaria magnacalcarata]|uniref:Exportin-2 C-terminal domain-containing protein n=1 Tax=Rotaria magnacalcarata TaxID=392030 RepID=A0A8S3DTF3_9BILA|nr:unnamed protein product [Rotaria magnacalcarata]